MANDQNLILLNATGKNGRVYSGQIAVDVNDITNPIPDGGVSPLVVHVKNSTVNTLGDANNVDAWTVSDSMSAIANQNLNFAIITITKIESRGTQHPTIYSSPKNILFFLPNIVGAAENVVTGGCSFLYNVQGDPIPVKYYSNLTVSQLISAAPVGGITSVNGNTGPAVSLAVISTAVGQSLTWSGTTLQLPTAGHTTSHGLLSGSDWDTFTAKVGGSGTTNKIAKWSSAGAITDSQLFDDGTNVGLGTVTPGAFYHISCATTSGGVWGGLNDAFRITSTVAPNQPGVILDRSSDNNGIAYYSDGSDFYMIPITAGTPSFSSLFQVNSGTFKVNAAAAYAGGAVVYSTAGNTGMYLSVASSAAYVTEMHRRDTADFWKTAFNGADLVWYATGGGNKVTFAQTGRVGVGVLSPSYDLDTAGDINTATGYRVGAVAGFTGTGAYTNFTIVGGIITNAS